MLLSPRSGQRLKRAHSRWAVDRELYHTLSFVLKMYLRRHDPALSDAAGFAISIGE